MAKPQHLHNCQANIDGNVYRPAIPTLFNHLTKNTHKVWTKDIQPKPNFKLKENSSTYIIIQDDQTAFPKTLYISLSTIPTILIILIIMIFLTHKRNKHRKHTKAKRQNKSINELSKLPYQQAGTSRPRSKNKHRKWR